MSDTKPFVAVAGATGQLGSLIALELRKRDVAVKALVRPGTEASRIQRLRDTGVEVTEVDLTDITNVTKVLEGAITIVSALQGLRDVILGVQGALLEAAVAAKVRRFIPSDFALDFTKTKPGSNRNLDLRREFHRKLDASGIEWTSVLNGAFMDLVTSDQSPMISDRWHRIPHFGSVDQKFDVTTVPDIAAYTAAVAIDPRTTPKVLRIAGGSFSAKDLAEIVSRVRGQKYTPMWTGSLGFVRSLIRVLKFVIGGEDDQVFPVWQAMQYLENMISGAGKLEPLDNDRYPDVNLTTVEQALKEADAAKAKVKSS